MRSGVATTPAQAQDAGLVVTPATARPWRVAPAENFTGTVRVQPTFDATAMTRAYAASVAFESGARTAWHTHARGQVLIVTSGVGRVQRWEGPVQEIWARPGLSQRDRGLVTVSALIAMNRPDQLRSHLTRARDNGVTLEEVVETITHLAIYAGWPNAVTAVNVAREVFAEALR